VPRWHGDFRFSICSNHSAGFISERVNLPMAWFDGHYDALAHQAIARFLLDAMRKDDDTIIVS
jgi:hypothetical protein